MMMFLDQSSACFSRVSLTALLLASCLGAATPSLAASPEGEGSVYAPVRYDDDAAKIAAGTGANDFWRPLKHIDLAADPAIWLGLSGELRERYETYVNPSFNIKAPHSNGYVLHRFNLFGDLHLGENFRVFAELGEALRFGRRNVSSTTDVDRLDAQQAFVEYRVPGTQIIARIGREELTFGWQRLIAQREGPNVRRSFDGGRVTAKFDDVTIDLLAVRPVNPRVDMFDNTFSHTQSLWGVYSTTSIYGPLKADLYVLGYENGTAKYRGLIGREQRLSIGTRLFGKTPDFDWNIEAVDQSGTYRNLNIDAWMLAAVTGVSFPDVPFKPRLGLEGNLTSGDTGSTQKGLGTFNAMFPRLPYFAETSMLVPSNIYNVRPTVTFTAVEDVVVVLGWDFLWRKSNKDGLYSSGQVLIPNTNKVKANRIGNEASLDVRYRYNEHLQFGAIYARFNAGPTITQAGGKSVDFGVGFATYKF